MTENPRIDNIMDGKACIHCHQCQEHCAFLKKYQIDIGDVDRLEELAFHCFLCGVCTQVCPAGIDGRELILTMRRRQTEENGGKPPGKGYGMLLKEKRRYQFRNDQNQTGKTILFPGCNFPAYYPQTTKYLAELLWKKAGIGVVFDCCGKPIAELGMRRDEERIIGELNDRFTRAGIEEVIMVCPNCYDFLKGKLQARIVTIYEKLKELGLGRELSGDIRLYLPCPDRSSGEFLAKIEDFLTREPDVVRDVQCCGLGGCGRVLEPQIAQEMLQTLQPGEKIYTYCASCCGAFTRRGDLCVRHVLAEILGINEQADAKNALLNRMKFKYWKEKR